MGGRGLYALRRLKSFKQAQQASTAGGGGGGGEAAPKATASGGAAASAEKKGSINWGTGTDYDDKKIKPGVIKFGKNLSGSTVSNAEMVKEYESWRKSLSTTEKKAIGLYRSSAYTPLNRTLRGKAEEGTNRISKNDQTRYRNAAKQIEKATTKQASKNLIVFRGTNYSDDAMAARVNRPGAVWFDRGITSTSTDPNVASRFVNKYKANPTVYTVIVPKGVRTAHLEGIKNGPSGEREVLLPRFARMRTIRRESDVKIFKGGETITAQHYLVKVLKTRGQYGRVYGDPKKDALGRTKNRVIPLKSVRSPAKGKDSKGKSKPNSGGRVINFASKTGKKK